MTTLLDKVGYRIEHDLTFEQRQVVNTSGKVAVIACPGSGKTRVVAYRLAKHIADPNLRQRGIAVLSFTNGAIEEIAQQITDLGISYPLPNPHFLGTIDSFLHQHLFRPHGHLVMGCSSAPEIVRPEQKSILQKYMPEKAKTVCLESKPKTKVRAVYLADIAYSPTGDLDLARIMEGVVFWSKGQFPRIEVKQAKQTYAMDGLATHSDALYWSYKLVSSQDSRWIVEAIQSRFNFWILDEAQDTSVLHALILKEFWSSNQTDVLVVGDPDQAIYEWHKALPSFLPNLVRRQQGWQQLLMTENRRSSQSICNATHPFRNLKLSTKPSIAAGNCANLEIKPMVLVFDSSEYCFLPQVLRSIWNLIFGEMDASPKLAIVAWRNDTVAKIRGRKSATFPATEVSQALFNVFRYYKQNQESKAYQLLEQVVSHLLLERPSFGPNYELLPRAITYSDWVALRAELFGRITAFDPTHSVNEFVESTRKILQEFIREFGPKVGAGLSAKIKVRNKAEGTAPILSFLETATDSNITINTVHQMKGTTLDGIMLVGGYDGETKNSDVAAWVCPPNQTTGYCEEPRRIAYVAMTRPRKLLVVAIPRECGNALIYHKDWKKGNFEYMQIEDVLSLGK